MDSVTEAGCMAHARRKFYDVHVRTPTEETQEALRRFGELYAIEAKIRGSPAGKKRRSDGVAGGLVAKAG